MPPYYLFDGFSEAGAVEEEEDVVKTGTGGIDPGDGLRRIYKPTGLLDRKKPDIERRIEESREIHAEVLGRIAKELRDSVVEIELSEFKAIQDMTRAEVDFEIGALMHKQLKSEEEEILLLMLLAVA